MATVPNPPLATYQFRVCLKHISPMIWRRCLIQTDKTLVDLHYVMQIMMGWTNCHLNEFKIHGKHYTVANGVGMISPNGASAKDVRLCDLKLRLNRRFHYAYDFTAGWEFDIRLERLLSYDEKKTYPTCLSGSGASPDEECGGPEDFNRLKEEWEMQCHEVMFAALEAITDKNNYDKSAKEVIDPDQLRQAIYWASIDKYKRRQVNRYLKHYANNDDRWLDAFDEVIWL